MASATPKWFQVMLKGGSDMKALRRLFAAAMVAMSAMVLMAGAAPPSELDYQGKVLINDLPFTGSGYFKFAISDAGGSTNYWAQDGSANGEPAAHMTNEVFNGVFSTVLGATPMSSLNPAIFSLNTSLYLRVWFSTTTGGFAEMLPAQRLVSVPYALNAELLDGYHATGIVSAATNAVTLSGDVSGPVGNVQLQPNVVGTAELSNNSVNSVKIVDGTIGTIDIADGTVASVDIAADTIQAADIAADAVGSSELLDGGILDVDVGASAAIQGSKLQPGSLTNAGALRLATGSTGTQAIATGHPYLNAFGVVNTLTAAAPNSALSVVGAGSVSIGVTQPNILTISGTADLPPANLVWVSATQGNDLTADGSAAKPFQTAQMAYNYADAVYGLLNQPAAIVLAAGVYPGPLQLVSVGGGHVHVFGLGRAELGTLSVASPAAPFLNSKQRIENVVVTGTTYVGFTGSDVKFHNVKMLNGLQIWGSRVEVQNCYIINRGDAPHTSSLEVGQGMENPVSDIGIYHSCIEHTLPGNIAVQVNPQVINFEMLWNEIINTGGGPAIADLEPGPITPVHLYAHNWIKGPSPLAAVPAVQDPNAGQNGPTIAFYNNSVFGNVGMGGHSQYYGNNYVYGRITTFAGTRWTQAGAVVAPGNTSNDTEHQPENVPALPNTYRD